MVDDITQKVDGKNKGKEDNVSLTDSESSYVIEEEIVEYELSGSDEEKSMNTKKSSKASKKNNDDNEKNEQNEFFETALKMKEEEEIINVDDGAVINIDDDNKDLNDTTVTEGKLINDENKDEPMNLSFKNVSDSMENIKTRLSSTHLDDSYNKINFNKTDTEFERDIKRMRYVVSRINATQNELKKALHDIKDNPFSIPEDEPYNDIASECHTESVADVNVDYCEDNMFNIDEAEIFEKYILCIDEDNRDAFADHFENLYNSNELFKRVIFCLGSSVSSNSNRPVENVAVA